MFILVFYTPATWLAITECIVLGGLTAAIGFNVMHDGFMAVSAGING